MCVASMIYDYYDDMWKRKFFPCKVIESSDSLPPIPYVPNFPTKEEIDEFRRLLERAREYDKKNHEPDCEMEEKKNKLRELATELGIEDQLKFIDDGDA